MMAIHLPFEILTLILGLVTDIRDLQQARRASRTLCAAATPLVFRVLSVASTRRSAQNLGHLIEVPDISAHVREVIYLDSGADKRGRTLKYVRTSAVRELANSFAHIHQLPLLEAITLTFFPSYGFFRNSDVPGHRTLQGSLLNALAASFGVRTPNLRSLTIRNLHVTHLDAFGSPTFQTVLKPLRHLQLSTLFDSVSDDDRFLANWRSFWGITLPRYILEPTQHALTTLTLHSDAHVGASSALSLATLHFPHLHMLSLRKLVFDPSVAAETFVLRHASTLARLELVECAICMHSTDLNPASPTHRGWVDVWERFSAELVTLVALHVDQRRVDRWGLIGPERRILLHTNWQKASPVSMLILSGYPWH
ncbi:hypothetical protein B0F90DRAFT_1696617 [Multifurca ochricompacta]|uniref:F-box domain-containing protein n=1 Tax=Multifurca ochricompacta TaxID=376703 RepID=A0AAD4MA91_9AGAM|nr:hypothetical protein B0F90DRAFT_1696617 [Multifurca ochricompacta]